MTIDVNYDRDNGGTLILNEQQRAQLQALLDTQLALADPQQNGNPATLGLGTPLYELILSFISDPGVDSVPDPNGGPPIEFPILVPKAGVDPVVWRWIDGAT